MQATYHARQKTWTLFDGKRLVLKARQMPRIGWKVKTYGFCLPEANKPNVFGITDASLCVMRHKRDVDRLIKQLTG